MAVPTRHSLISPPAAEFPPWARWGKGELVIDVHVQPAARRSGVLGEHGGRLKIAVRAPPVEGQANLELLRYLGEALSVPRNSVRIVSGASGRRKSVALQADAAQALALLRALCEAGPAPPRRR